MSNKLWKLIPSAAAAIAAITFLVFYIDAKAENTNLHSRVVELETRIHELEGKVDELVSERQGLRDAYRNLVVMLIKDGKVVLEDIDRLLPDKEVKLVEQRTSKVAIIIPLTSGWQPQGPGARGGGYADDGIVELEARLHGGDDYAELFLDLRPVRLSRIKRNPDGSYDLSGMELVATVRSDHNFKGDPHHPNGAQFLLKNKQWNNLVGTWLNITDAMMTATGMKIFYKVPDNIISKNVAGMSLKFTIGSNSKQSYEGSFTITSVEIVKNE